MFSKVGKEPGFVASIAYWQLSVTTPPALCFCSVRGVREGVCASLRSHSLLPRCSYSSSSPRCLFCVLWSVCCLRGYSYLTVWWWVLLLCVPAGCQGLALPVMSSSKRLPYASFFGGSKEELCLLFVCFFFSAMLQLYNKSFPPKFGVDIAGGWIAVACGSRNGKICCAVCSLGTPREVITPSFNSQA